jgi:hypothetical protein
MANFVLIHDAVNETSYSVTHIRTLLTRGTVQGKKSGGIWLIDLDDLKDYEKRMQTLGEKKHTTNKNKTKSEKLE